MDGECATGLSQDAQTLAALRSLSPEVRADGTWVVDMRPAQLAYLRRRVNVREGPRSPGAHDRQRARAPRVGRLPVPAVRAHPEACRSRLGTLTRQGTCVPDRVIRTSSGDYARRQRLVPIPADLSRRDRALLESGSVTLPPGADPGLLSRDLVVLGSGFDAVLIGEAADIQVLDADAIRPVVRLDTQVPGWLDFDVRFEVAGKPFPPSCSAAPTATVGTYRCCDVGGCRSTFPRCRHCAPGQVGRRACQRSPPAARAPVCHGPGAIVDIGGRHVASEASQALFDELTSFHADPAFRPH